MIIYIYTLDYLRIQTLPPSETGNASTACRSRPYRATAGMCLAPQHGRNMSLPHENCADTFWKMKIAMGHHHL